MCHPSTPKILILSDDADAADRWAGTLAGLECRVFRDRHDLAGPDHVDLILTDAYGLPPDGQCPAPDRWTPEAIGESLVGVVRIGGQGPADVHLPPDAGQGELLLACRLLAQIVELRRAVRAGAEKESRLRRQTLRDPLTGLPNRRAWDEALAELLRSPSPPDRRLAVAILDLDHFKQVNDTRGHSAGDEVLRLAGEAIQHGLRQGDFVARLGGDEFGLLLWLPAGAAAATVLDRVRRHLPDRLERSGIPPITASVGYWLAAEVSTACPSSPQQPFEAADAALRQAKQTGRDRTVATTTH